MALSSQAVCDHRLRLQRCCRLGHRVNQGQSSMYRPVVNANFTPLAGQGTPDAVDLELDRRHHDLNGIWQFCLPGGGVTAGDAGD